ncbi:sigma-54-dependent transcriptional regulator [candidate division KSB1 bacterium]
MNVNLLIIDDDPALLRLLRARCAEYDNIACFTAESGRSGVDTAAENSIDVVLLDFELPDIDGSEVLKSLKQNDPFIEVIVITAYGSIDRAVEMIKLGASDFLTKPIEFDRLFIILQNIIERQSLSKRLSLFEDSAGKVKFIGKESAAAKKLMNEIQQAALSDTTILLQGESGTGKEILSRLVHTISGRASKPFIKVDCTALQDTLVQSELFGHEKGAFTGAISLKRGKIELADKGTVFLDEIGDLHENMQGKLLRLLQDREFERVGGVKPLKADIRIIAATNKTLKDLVENDRFREDLYYRLNVVVIDVPPLRNRVEDVPHLTRFFFDTIGKEMNKPVNAVDDKIIDLFCRYPWPGNVREMKNVIERLIVFSENGRINDKYIPVNIGSVLLNKDEPPLPLKEAVNRFKKEYIKKILSENDGNISEAAEQLGINRTYLYSLIEQLNIGEF